MAGRVPALRGEGMGGPRRPPRPIASSRSLSASSSSSSSEEEEEAGAAREGWQANWEGGRGKGIAKIS